MLNVILVLGMAVNLLAGFFFILKVEPIVWGRRGTLIHRAASSQDAAFRGWATDSPPDGWENGDGGTEGNLA